jgi:hypothetical protein
LGVERSTLNVCPFPDRIERLILRTGGDTVLGQRSQETLQLALTGHMNRQCLYEVAISPEPGDIRFLRVQGKVLSAQDIRQFPQGFQGGHVPAVIYDNLSYINS